LLGSGAWAQSYDPLDVDTWSPDVLDWDASPVDLSFLNHRPAGSRGFVRAVGDQLVFGDGTPARFWAGNIAAWALFVDDAQIDAQARRIARLGFNLMRIHHHDSMAWVSPTVIDKSQNDSRQLDAVGMERVDYWIKALKENGVYVWLDLHVGRQFQPGDVDTIHGTIAGYDEIVDTFMYVKGFSYYNDAVRELMKEFNENYLTHVNPYTQLAYKDDPAIMGVLVTNENDITHHFENRTRPSANHPVHQAIFETRAKAFATKKGFPAAEVLASWAPGPSKIFLNEQEHLFNLDTIQHLASIGLRVPVATTNMWGANPLYALPPVMDGNVVDAHAYGGAEALSANPREEANYISWIGASQAYDMPLTVTEWNTPYPTVDRFTAPLYVASLASLQGWDAPMIYNYSQSGKFNLTGPVPTWSTFVDPSMTGMMPAAALAYREGHVSQAQKTYCLDLDREELYYRRTSAGTSRAVRTLMEQSRFTVCLPDIPELDWDRASEPAPDVLLVVDPNRDYIPAGQNFVESDTGELLRNWEAGVHTIDTPKTQAASGWIGGRRVELSGAAFEIATPKAAVAVSSVDGQPLDRSARILVTALGQAASPTGNLPLLAEPITGTLFVTARRGMQLFPIGPDGGQGDAIQPPYDGTTYSLELGSMPHWLMLVPEPSGAALHLTALMALLALGGSRRALPSGWTPPGCWRPHGVHRATPCSRHHQSSTYSAHTRDQ
jgi:hypothetical protein